MTESLMPLPAMAQTPTSVPPAILLANHLKALKLPTFVREYEKVALEAAQDRADYTAVAGDHAPSSRQTTGRLPTMSARISFSVYNGQTSTSRPSSIAVPREPNEQIFMEGLEPTASQTIEVERPGGRVRGFSSADFGRRRRAYHPNEPGGYSRRGRLHGAREHKRRHGGCRDRQRRSSARTGY